MVDIYKDDAYIEQEISNAWQWMTQSHSQAEWEAFIKGVTIMYLNCNEEMRIAIKSILNEAITRKILSRGK